MSAAGQLQFVQEEPVMTPMRMCITVALLRMCVAMAQEHIIALLGHADVRMAPRPIAVDLVWMFKLIRLIVAAAGLLVIVEILVWLDRALVYFIGQMVYVAIMLRGVDTMAILIT